MNYKEIGSLVSIHRRILLTVIDKTGKTSNDKTAFSPNLEKGIGLMATIP